MKLYRIAAAGLALITAASAASAQTPQRKNVFQDAKLWGYQLTNLVPEQQAKIAASPYDLVVIDMEQSPQDGDTQKETLLTREEIERMKVKPDGGRRLIIAYLSIGEAENYRYYWKPAWNSARPSWTGKENKDWKGNYLTKYWEPEWQNIVFGNPNAIVDRMIAQGFDGFYLDRVDAYYYFGDTKDMRDRMAGFVRKLTDYIRSKKPDAGILVQNAEELLDRPDYVAAIDGIAKESLLYGIKKEDIANTKDDVDWSSKLLKTAQNAGKKIFVVEYLANKQNMADAKKRLDDMGFVMYVGTRGLGTLLAPGEPGGPRRGLADPNPREDGKSGVAGVAQKAKFAVKNAAEAAKQKAIAAKETVSKAVKGKQQEPAEKKN